jgi:hypothetical protein
MHYNQCPDEPSKIKKVKKRIESKYASAVKNYDINEVEIIVQLTTGTQYNGTIVPRCMITCGFCVEEFETSEQRLDHLMYECQELTRKKIKGKGIDWLVLSEKNERPVYRVPWSQVRIRVKRMNQEDFVDDFSHLFNILFSA